MGSFAWIRHFVLLAMAAVPAAATTWDLDLKGGAEIPLWTGIKVSLAFNERKNISFVLSYEIGKEVVYQEGMWVMDDPAYLGGSSLEGLRRSLDGHNVFNMFVGARSVPSSRQVTLLSGSSFTNDGGVVFSVLSKMDYLVQNGILIQQDTIHLDTQQHASGTTIAAANGAVGVFTVERKYLPKDGHPIVAPAFLPPTRTYQWSLLPEQSAARREQDSAHTTHLVNNRTGVTAGRSVRRVEVRNAVMTTPRNTFNTSAPTSSSTRGGAGAGWYRLNLAKLAQQSATSGAADKERAAVDAALAVSIAGLATSRWGSKRCGGVFLGDLAASSYGDGKAGKYDDDVSDFVASSLDKRHVQNGDQGLQEVGGDAASLIQYFFGGPSASSSGQRRGGGGGGGGDRGFGSASDAADSPCAKGDPACEQLAGHILGASAEDSCGPLTDANPGYILVGGSNLRGSIAAALTAAGQLRGIVIDESLEDVAKAAGLHFQATYVNIFDGRNDSDVALTILKKWNKTVTGGAVAWLGGETADDIIPFAADIAVAGGALVLPALCSNAAGGARVQPAAGEPACTLEAWVQSLVYERVGLGAVAFGGHAGWKESAADTITFASMHGVRVVGGVYSLNNAVLFTLPPAADVYPLKNPWTPLQPDDGKRILAAAASVSVMYDEPAGGDGFGESEGFLAGWGLGLESVWLRRAAVERLYAKRTRTDTFLGVLGGGGGGGGGCTSCAGVGGEGAGGVYPKAVPQKLLALMLIIANQYANTAQINSLYVIDDSEGDWVSGIHDLSEGVGGVVTLETDFKMAIVGGGPALTYGIGFRYTHGNQKQDAATFLSSSYVMHPSHPTNEMVDDIVGVVGANSIAVPVPPVQRDSQPALPPGLLKPVPLAPYSPDPFGGAARNASSRTAETAAAPAYQNSLPMYLILQVSRGMTAAAVGDVISKTLAQVKSLGGGLMPVITLSQLYGAAVQWPSMSTHDRIDDLRPF